MNPNRFRIAVAVVLCGALVLALADPAAAFIRLTRLGPNGVVQAHWLDSELPLSSVVNSINKDIPSATALSTIQASGQSWQDVASSYFTVNVHEFAGAPELAPALALDLQHSVLFDTLGTNFAPGGGVIAFVRSAIDLSNGHTIDADMVFNDRDFFWSVSSPGLTPAPTGQTSVDLQAVTTHEYGHYFSLDHTSIAGSTMIPFIQNNISQRSLELDDRAGLSTVYPEADFHATTGRVSGTVLSGFNGSAVFGAHVEAINLAAPSSANSISAISGELTLRNGQGDYTIYGLPPGSYAIRIVPLDGINTTAADPNVGGVFNGLDINFEPEFWNGAGEGGNGFTDSPNLFDAVAVSGGATSGGVNFVTNAYAGRVIIAQHGQFENFVTFRNTGYLAVRFDPPFEGPYTISSVNFPSFTFNGVPASFLSARLCRMIPATGLPDIANPIFIQTPFNGSPNGNNIVPINYSVTQPKETFFWLLQFPSSAAPGFPNNYPFMRMDLTNLERGLFANSYSISLAGATSLAVDRNYSITMTCQLPDANDTPMTPPTGLGANHRATQMEFNFRRPADLRADGFPTPPNSHESTILVKRDPFGPGAANADQDTTGAGSGSIHMDPVPSMAAATIWSVQGVDANGHRSLNSNVTILGPIGGLGEDADEPNGKINEATVLTTPVTNRAETYWPAGDQDYYQVLARPGDVILASATATGQDGNNNMDLVMFLYDNSGDLVAFNDDFTGLNPRVQFTVPPSSDNSKSMTPRKFRIHVTDFAGSALQPNGIPQVRTPQTYTLSASVTAPALAARIGGRTLDPDAFYFGNSGPNPANPVAKFLFVVPRGAGNTGVKLNIYDVNGRLVRSLVDRTAAPGPHTVIWDGKDGNGSTVASGNYFARMQAGSFQQDARVTILK